MNISSAKYGVNDKGKNHCIIIVVDGVTMYVPLAEDNTEYEEIMRQVDAGTLTIAAAD